MILQFFRFVQDLKYVHYYWYYAFFEDFAYCNNIITGVNSGYDVYYSFIINTIVIIAIWDLNYYSYCYPYRSSIAINCLKNSDDLVNYYGGGYRDG